VVEEFCWGVNAMTGCLPWASKRKEAKEKHSSRFERELEENFIAELWLGSSSKPWGKN